MPPAALPSPDLKNLPFLALRDFDNYKMRAQMNTKYMDSSTREATVTHVLNLLISRLTSADIRVQLRLMKVKMFLGMFIILKL